MTAFNPFLPIAPTDVEQALDFARTLVGLGVSVFTAQPDESRPTGYRLPPKWQTIEPDTDWVNGWRPGMALCAVMGRGLDVVDVDPRHGGTVESVPHPEPVAVASTPSGGMHLFVPSTGVRSLDGIAAGVDLKAGNPNGVGRGFAFLAPTVRRSKVTGEPTQYRWTMPPTREGLATAQRDATGLAALRAYVEERRASAAASADDTAWRTESQQWALLGDFRSRFPSELRSWNSAGWSCGARSTLLSRSTFLAKLAPELAEALWREAFDQANVAPDVDDLDHIATALKGVAADVIFSDSEVGSDPDQLSPFWLNHDLSPITDRAASVEVSADVATTIDPSEAEIEKTLRHLKVQEEARRRLNAERRKNRPSIESGIIDDLDSIEDPVMLLDSLIPELAVGFLAGRSGAYKSFLAVSWACCIATGCAWLDRFAVARPLKTLYVAAEGAKGAAARMRAWEKHTGVSRSGKLHLYPKAIHLNDEAQVEELTAVVKAGGYEFLVIDTFHRSAPGTDENSSTEFGIVFEAVARLRDDFGCSTLFVDHTGHNGERIRATSAKGDDGDYVLFTSYAGEDRGPNVQRWLSVRKLKDEETPSDKWPIQLQPVGGNTVLGESSFPVVVIGEVDKRIQTERNPDGTVSVVPNEDDPWWHFAKEMPTDDREMLISHSNEKRGVKLAEWIWRLLADIDSPDGMTRSEIMKNLKDIPEQLAQSDASFNYSIALLKKANIVNEFNRRFTVCSRAN